MTISDHFGGHIGARPVHLHGVLPTVIHLIMLLCHLSPGITGLKLSAGHLHYVLGPLSVQVALGQLQTHNPSGNGSAISQKQLVTISNWR